VTDTLVYYRLIRTEDGKPRAVGGIFPEVSAALHPITMRKEKDFTGVFIDRWTQTTEVLVKTEDKTVNRVMQVRERFPVKPDGTIDFEEE
jgi:hypothetical protein